MSERERLIEILKDNQGDSAYYMTVCAKLKRIRQVTRNDVFTKN